MSTTTSTTTTILRAEGFSCPSCVAKIEKTLGRTEGVNDVKVMFNSNKVKVRFDESLTGADKLASVVTGLGYPVKKTAVA